MAADLHSCKRPSRRHRGCFMSDANAPGSFRALSCVHQPIIAALKSWSCTSLRLLLQSSCAHSATCAVPAQVSTQRSRPLICAVLSLLQVNCRAHVGGGISSSSSSSSSSSRTELAPARKRQYLQRACHLRRKFDMHCAVTPCGILLTSSLYLHICNRGVVCISSSRAATRRNASSCAHS